MKKNIYIIIAIFLMSNLVMAQNRISKKRFTPMAAFEFGINQYQLSPVTTDFVSVEKISLPNPFTYDRATKAISLGFVHRINKHFEGLYFASFLQRNEIFDYELLREQNSIKNVITKGNVTTYNTVLEKNIVNENRKLNYYKFSLGLRYTLYPKSVYKLYSSNYINVLKSNDYGKYEMSVTTGLGLKLPFLGRTLHIEPNIEYNFNQHESYKNEVNIKYSSFGIKFLLN